MAFYKCQEGWVLKGVCSTNNDIMSFWGTNFNMPVPNLFAGSSTYATGYMSTRYCDVQGTSEAFPACFVPGYELVVADNLYRWCVTDGDCYNGIVRTQLKWYRGATYLHQQVSNWCIDIVADNPGWTNQWVETMTNVGIAGWEVCCDGTYCTISCADCVSGDDLSMAGITKCMCWTCVPAVTQIQSGQIWVEGNDLHYFNKNEWEHIICGTCQGSASGDCGSLWIDNTHYLNWTGGDGNVYQAPWRICQFCSYFSNGPPVNPSPGASYAGNLWVDDEFGCTHLSYIGCDGNKYLAGAGNYPYSAP